MNHNYLYMFDNVSIYSGLHLMRYNRRTDYCWWYQSKQCTFSSK